MKKKKRKRRRNEGTEKGEGRKNSVPVQKPTKGEGRGGGILEYPERCIQVKRGRRNRLFCQGRKKERREEREKDEQNGMQEKWKMKFDSINQREKSYTFNKQTRKI